MYLNNYIFFNKNIYKIFYKILLFFTFLIISNFIINNYFLSILLLYATVIGLLIFYKIEFGIISYLLIILFQPKLSTYISTPLLQNLDELLIIFLTILTIASISTRRIKFSKTFLNKYFYMLLFIILLSTLANQVPYKNLFLFINSIIKPLLLFFIIINMNIREVRSLKLNFLRIIMLIGLIQIPFVLYNIYSTGGISVALGRSFYYVGDYIIGTFASSDTVGYLVIINIIISYILYLNERSRDKRKLYGLVFTIFCLILIVASVKRLIITLPFIFIIGLIFSSRRKNNIVVITGLSFILISSIFFFEKNIFLNKSFFSLNRNVNPLLRVEKINGYYDLFSNARLDMSFKSLGAGPGMYGSSVAQKLQAPFAEKYINYYTKKITVGGGGTLMTRSSAVLALISEIGIISFILILAMLFNIYKKTTSSLKIIKIHNPINYVYGLSLLSLVPVVIILSFFQNIFEGGFIICVFWTLCGMVFNKDNPLYVST